MTSEARVADLSITYLSAGTAVHAVDGVSFSLAPGQCLGLVGESGSGKSTVGSALQGLLTREPHVRASGTIDIGGTQLDPGDDHGWDRIRGHRVTTVFQDPMASLDPLMTIGRMMDRVTGSREETIRWLQEVEIRKPEAVAVSYPHQLSGGMRQRVMIALALSRRPSVLIADEATTALDVGVQAQILSLLHRERERLGCAVVFITHDLGVAGAMCDDVAVMHQGRIVEKNTATTVFTAPAHPYTRRLMASRITLTTDRARPVGEPESTVIASITENMSQSTSPDVASRWESGAFTWGDLTPTRRADSTGTVLQLADVTKNFPTGGIFKRQHTDVLHGVSFHVADNESVALVGESGSGKSTILRIAAGLETVSSGTVTTVDPAHIQVIFQDAGSSLTPWMTVRQLLTERLRNTPDGRSLTAEQTTARIETALERVALPLSALHCRPGQLSGGQRQRVAIARAVVVPPRILLCDEPTSALDVSVACTVLNLLNVLRHTLGISILFVTHDLAAARIISDRVLVIESGRIVETVASGELQEAMTSPYGKGLLDAVLA